MKIFNLFSFFVLFLFFSSLFYFCSFYINYSTNVQALKIMPAFNSASSCSSCRDSLEMSGITAGLCDPNYVSFMAFNESDTDILSLYFTSPCSNVTSVLFQTVDEVLFNYSFIPIDCCIYCILHVILCVFVVLN